MIADLKDSTADMKPTHFVEANTLCIRDRKEVRLVVALP
jgi:hypothetical protein